MASPTSSISPIADREPLALSHLTPFGKGGRRLCFIHPQCPEKCVKVLRQDESRTVRGKKSGWVPAHWRRAYDNNRHEWQVLSKLSRRLGPAMRPHLPVCDGFVETDLGQGLILDLVRDDDGQISRSLREIISTGGRLEDLRPAFDQLGEFLLEYRVLTRSLLDHNISCRSHADGTWTMCLIDGLGDPAWLPFTRWSSSLSRKRILRKLESAWQRFEQLRDSGGVTEELRAKSTWDQGFLAHRGIASARD